MAEFNDDQNCFVCGKDNGAGLQLLFREGPSAGWVEADVVFPGHLQGWQDTVHGGILATVLDEAMIKAAHAAGIRCVTAEITVRYRKPAATEVAYRVLGTLSEAGRIVTAEARIEDASGQVFTQATGRLFRMK